VWIFGDVWCSIWLAVDVWMCTASILNLCAISLDRYVAVTRPVTYPSIMSSGRAKLLIAGVWVLSFVICFPPLVGWKDKRDDPLNSNVSSTMFSSRQQMQQTSPLEACRNSYNLSFISLSFYFPSRERSIPEIFILERSRSEAERFLSPTLNVAPTSDAAGIEAIFPFTPYTLQ
ncbi:hypothetical protein L9F63_011200, partial [Diploptera punctata]